MTEAVVEPGFAAAVGMTRPIRLRVEHATAGVLAEGELDQPFAVVGSAPECEVALNDPTLPGRTAALQVIDGRAILFPFDTLTPATLATGATWKVGDFSLSRTDEHAHQPNADPLRLPANSPRVTLELRTDRGTADSFRLDQRVAFVGRSPRCAVRLDALEVADVHAYLLLADGGVWVVDLQSDAGTGVNGESVRVAQLHDGDELGIGPNRITVRCDRWGEVILSSPAPASEPELSVSPQPHSLWTDEPDDLIPLVTATPPVLPAPPQANPDTVSLFQYVAAMHGHLMTEFRRSMDEMVTAFGQMQQQQMQAMQVELNRLAELNTELHKLHLQAKSPPPAPTSPAAPLYHPLPDPAAVPPMSDETASRHQWVAARLAEIEAERGSIWTRIKGMFVRSGQPV